MIFLKLSLIDIMRNIEDLFFYIISDLLFRWLRVAQFLAEVNGRKIAQKHIYKTFRAE